MKFVTAPLAAALMSGAALADQSITYDISFDNAAHHEAEITVTVTGVETDTLDMLMSRASPGRYALHEFAKNVYNVSATNGAGDKIDIVKPTPYGWRVSDHDGTVKVTYTLFADHADGTYSAVDRTHAHLNIPATFMWAKGIDNTPITVNFTPFADNWKVATQLERTDKPYTYTAPNLAYFLDSPTELSNHGVRSWTVSSNGKDYKINLAVHHDGTDEDLDTYAAKSKAVVDAQIKVFGEMPELDYGEYTFIACYLPHVDGDGMEHRNSTIITNTTSLDEGDYGQLGTLSHEFIHTWNVERIRPKELEPFDFTRANMTNNLWFAEGFTSYYGPLTIRRAGENSVKGYLKNLSYTVNSAYLKTGPQYFSPEGASRMAAFTDASTSVDRHNFSNIFFSYYTYGASVGLALDLTLRSQFQGITLDSYMQLMWKKYGKPEIPYTRDDLRITLGELINDQAFADQFFANHVSGSKVPDFKGLLANAGVIVSQNKLKQTYAGPISFKFNGEAAIVANQMQVGSPLYKAGISQGDRILQLGRRTIRSNSLWKKALKLFKPGDTTQIIFESRGQTITANITFTGDPAYSLSLNTGASDAQIAFRDSWLGRAE